MLPGGLTLEVAQSVGDLLSVGVEGLARLLAKVIQGHGGMFPEGAKGVLHGDDAGRGIEGGPRSGAGPFSLLPRGQGSPSQGLLPAEEG